MFFYLFQFHILDLILPGKLWQLWIYDFVTANSLGIELT